MFCIYGPNGSRTPCSDRIEVLDSAKSNSNSNILLDMFILYIIVSVAYKKKQNNNIKTIHESRVMI